MTTQMRCEVFHERLMAYMEDETDAQTRVSLERHAVTCGDCGAMLADLRKLRIDAASLPELTPSRDLWSGIAARIDTPVVPIGMAVGVKPHPSRRAWQVGAMAASLVGAAALGYVAGQRPVLTGPAPIVASDTTLPAPLATAPGTEQTPTLAAPRQEVAQAPRGSAPADDTTAPAVSGEAANRPYSAQLVVATLTADYDREVARLTALLDSRRNQLDPVTVAIIERNLQVIDAAITESKQAIARDPASRFLIESLNQSLQMKVELMRTAAMLPSRT